ncbi:MAG: hypothetical protein FJY91_02865 [Candidatus Harrisonbacteria bacterium]|nr:hypothetical protein [Candidatus Harrisonbacteria bacterium]
MDRRNIIDFQKFVCQNLSDQIKQADTKAAAIISVLGLITASLLSRLSSIKVRGSLSETNMIVYCLAAALILVSLKFAIGVIFPRISKGKSTGLLYFGDISLMRKETFVKNITKIDETQISLEYANQAHALSAIAKRKYWNLRQAFILSSIALVFTIIALIVNQ